MRSRRPAWRIFDREHDRLAAVDSGQVFREQRLHRGGRRTGGVRRRARRKGHAEQNK
jgi:hypothetical protein